MTTELQLQTGIRATLLAIDEYFDKDTVRINSSVYLDQSADKMPGFEIITSSDFTSRQDTMTATGTWLIIGLLYIEFKDWEISYNEFRDVRQAIIDKFNEVGVARSPADTDANRPGITLNEIRAGSGIDGIHYDPADTQGTPVFLTQVILFDVELF